MYLSVANQYLEVIFKVVAPRLCGCRFKPRQGIIHIFQKKNLPDPVTMGNGDLTKVSALDINKAIIHIHPLTHLHLYLTEENPRTVKN